MSKNKKYDWTTDDWIKRLKQQADSSKSYRHKLYEKVDLQNKQKILDVGCGTGAVTADIAQLAIGDVTGIDNDSEKLENAKRVLSNLTNVKVMKGDVLDLPFEDESFDLVVFNIVLVYIKDQQRAVNEMARVTTPGGFVLATIEPDYASYIDYPDDPARPLLLESLKEIGADLQTGRRLKALFNTAGLETEIGMDTESGYFLIKDRKLELQRFKDDFWIFEKAFQKAHWAKNQIEDYRKQQIEKIQKGLSLKFTPCFYAIGRKMKT